MISNSSSFVGATWESYGTSKTWILTAGVGTKTVYVKFKDGYGNVSGIASDTIELSSTTGANQPASSSEIPATAAPEIIAKVTVTAPPEIKNSESKVIITPPAASSYQPGASLKFNYGYANETNKSVKIKIVRQLLNSKNRVVRSMTSYKVIKAGATFEGKVNESFAKSLSAGEYTEKISIYIGNKKVDENSFQITVEKLKKKYFILGGELPTPTDIAFDEKTWNKIKSDKVLPVAFKLKYSYTNNATEKKTIRMLREIVDENGKVVNRGYGKWIAGSGKTVFYSYSQNLSDKLSVGNYQLRLRAYDFTTQKLLAENSFGFTVELK